MDEVKIGETLEPGTQDEQNDRQQRVREKFWPKFKRVASTIPFSDDILAAYYCAMDPETPSRVRGILLAALAYFILPLDTLPDFIAGFGFTDDLAVLTAAFAAVRGNITPAHKEAAKRTLTDWQSADNKDDQAASD